MNLLLVYLFIALAFSFLCSLLEAVILSTTPSYVNMVYERGARYGKVLKSFKDDIDRPLAAILTLNTLAHTVGAAGVGAQAQAMWGKEVLSVASAVLTILILVFSEIIPKTLGAVHWKRLASFSVYSLQVLIFSPLYPFILISQVITRWLKQGHGEHPVSRDELSAMARMGTTAGIFKQKESLIIQNLMRFDYLLVRDIMTPRIVVHSAEENTPVRSFLHNISDIHFSRIPVYSQDKENITGYVLKDDLMLKMVHNQYGEPLSAFKRNIMVVTESMPLSSLYERFITEKEMIAMVVDEYGGMSGVVTMEDLIETILGLEIVDEYDTIDDLRKMARQKWKERARRLGFWPGNENGESQE